MRQAGEPHSRWHHLGHTATAVAAVVGVITGAFLGVLGSVVTPLATSVLAAGATVAAVTAFAGLLADQERRWQRSDVLAVPTPARRMPAMTVTAFGDRTSPSRAAPHSQLWLERTAAGQTQARPPAEPEGKRRPGTPEARPQKQRRKCLRWLLHRPPKKRLAGRPRPPCPTWALLSTRPLANRDDRARTRNRPRASGRDASAGSSLAVWRVGSWPPGSLPRCRSSRPNRANSPVQCSAGSPWAGRCWARSRRGSPTKPSDGRGLRRWSWVSVG